MKVTKFAKFTLIVLMIFGLVVFPYASSGALLAPPVATETPLYWAGFSSIGFVGVPYGGPDVLYFTRLAEGGGHETIKLRQTGAGGLVSDHALVIDDQQNAHVIAAIQMVNTWSTPELVHFKIQPDGDVIETQVPFNNLTYINNLDAIWDNGQLVILVEGYFSGSLSSPVYLAKKNPAFPGGWQTILVTNPVLTTADVQDVRLSVNSQHYVVAADVWNAPFNTVEEIKAFTVDKAMTRVTSATLYTNQQNFRYQDFHVTADDTGHMTVVHEDNTFPVINDTIRTSYYNPSIGRWTTAAHFSSVPTLQSLMKVDDGISSSLDQLKMVVGDTNGVFFHTSNNFGQTWTAGTTPLLPSSILEAYMPKVRGPLSPGDIIIYATLTPTVGAYRLNALFVAPNGSKYNYPNILTVEGAGGREVKVDYYFK